MCLKFILVSQKICENIDRNNDPNFKPVQTFLFYICLHVIKHTAQISYSWFFAELESVLNLLWFLSYFYKTFFLGYSFLLHSIISPLGTTLQLELAPQNYRKVLTNWSCYTFICILLKLNLKVYNSAEVHKN